MLNTQKSLWYFKIILRVIRAIPQKCICNEPCVWAGLQPHSAPALTMVRVTYTHLIVYNLRSILDGDAVQTASDFG